MLIGVQGTRKPASLSKMSVEDAAQPAKQPISSGLLCNTDYRLTTIDLRISAVRALEGKAAVHLALFPRHRLQTLLRIVPAGRQRGQRAESRTDSIQQCGHERPQALTSIDCKSRELLIPHKARELHVTKRSLSDPAHLRSEETATRHLQKQLKDAP